MTKAKKKGKRKAKVIPPQVLEQRLQTKEVRKLMSDIGFMRMPKVDGKEFNYQGRTSELDDVFGYENVIVIVEYTVKANPGDHIKDKIHIYNKILADPKSFLEFLIAQQGFENFSQAFSQHITNKYSFKQLQVRILYVSKNNVADEHRALAGNVIFFDYPIVKYFEGVAKIIKRSTMHEFFEFLGIPYSNIGENIKASSTISTQQYHAHLLPEEQSSFTVGYKIVTFYIDAASLMRRAFVLRRDGWKHKDNITFYQRMFSGQKIKSMRKYLDQTKRVFINNLIVTLSTDAIKVLDTKDKVMQIDEAGNFEKDADTKVKPAKIIIEDRSSVVGIIDGQHRLYAYHEGNDSFETSISQLRPIQNLLVTGILFPKSEPEEKRVKFEANLFLEINSNQSSAKTELKQEIEFMLNPFSITSVAKHILDRLNESGPLSGLLEEYWFQKAKLKTASIVSFGLRQLVKFEGPDSLFEVWSNKKKGELNTGKENYKLLNEYKDFAVEEIRKLFIAFKASIPKDRWKVDRSDRNAILSVTTVNGIINCLRFIIENNHSRDQSVYLQKLKGIESFPFKKYKSSQYRKMGEDLFKKFFN
jgi:DGQHR domain-containing protein